MAASRQVYKLHGVRCIPMYFPLGHFSDEWNYVAWQVNLLCVLCTSVKFFQARYTLCLWIF